MSWRTVVINGYAKLDYKLDYLVVRKQEGTSRIYIGEIGLLIIESTTISLTTMLLSELVKNKVKIIFCDEKKNPQSEVAPYYGAYDTSMKIKKQIKWGFDIKTKVWTEIVREKINNQLYHLNLLKKEEEGNLLRQYISELAPGDKTNREGHAAKVYFNAIFGMKIVV